jgi:succinyl-diaminopimelate desuccinylase
MIIKEIINFTRQLIKIPSQNGIDSERKIADFISKKLKNFGFLPKIIGPKEHPSVICFLKKPKAKKTIWFNAHLDTVQVGNLKKWRYSPFSGIIKKGRMYGRGVADSKVSISIFCYLAKALFESSDFCGNIFLGFDADEESGNLTGIKKILKIAPKFDLCILGYQNHKEIHIGARGWMRLKLITFGKSAHTGSKSKKGINAIHKMQKVIFSILNLKSLNKKEKFFEYGTAINFSLIKGGRVINVTPDECETFFELRILPFQDPESIFKKIIKTLNRLKKKDKELQFKIELLQAQKGFLTPIFHPFLRILKKNAQRIFKRKIKFATSGAGSVGNLIWEKKKIPIVNAFGCENGNVHSENEWVNVKDIPKVFEIYFSSLVEFLKTKQHGA